LKQLVKVPIKHVLELADQLPSVGVSTDTLNTMLLCERQTGGWMLRRIRCRAQPLSSKDDSWIKERRNHRMVWVGRDLKGHLVPTPLTWAGTSSTRPVSQSSIQPGLEHRQGGGSHSFSGQPVPVPHHSHGEEILQTLFYVSLDTYFQKSKAKIREIWQKMLCNDHTSPSHFGGGKTHSLLPLVDFNHFCLCTGTAPKSPSERTHRNFSDVCNHTYHHRHFKRASYINCCFTNNIPTNRSFQTARI